MGVECADCIIRVDTGEESCEGTPYYDHIAHRKEKPVTSEVRDARMLTYLEDLLSRSRVKKGVRSVAVLP